MSSPDRADTAPDRADTAPDRADTAPARRARRPLSVTLAVVLVAISGLLNTSLGVQILLGRYDVDADEVLPVSLIGAGVALFGLLTLAVASGIARGSRLSRILVTLYIIVQVPLHAVTIALADTWDVSATLQGLLDLLVLVILWTPPGSRHFRSRAPAPDPYAR